MSEENKTILLVDDDIDFMEQMKIFLESDGYKVVSFSSSSEAEKYFSENRPDLAIFDLMIEHYDSGFVLGYHLKKKYPDVPVIIATGVASETGYKFTGAEGTGSSWTQADLVMDKGIRPDQLLGEVKKLLKI
jgi:DNA-binding response OmpR family regulator